MATLSGQTIQSTYKGLLKLEDSTNGITQQSQQIQDGLGNNTGVSIKENVLTAPNIISPKLFKSDYYGNGLSTSAPVPVAQNNNQLCAIPFYDAGIYSYSALTYNLTTASSVSGEQFNVAFYNSQYISGVGLAPKDLIMSGISYTVTSPTGLKTISLPQTLSFSAGGGDIYFCCFSATSTASTYSFRIASQTAALNALIGQLNSGFVISTLGTSAQSFVKSNANVLGIQYSGITSFPDTFTTQNASSFRTDNINPISTGFLLHTIK